MTPTTEAGRRLLADWEHDPKELWTVEQVTADILAIEQEAVATERARLRAAIIDGASRATVLALLEDES